MLHATICISSEAYVQSTTERPEGLCSGKNIQGQVQKVEETDGQFGRGDRFHYPRNAGNSEVQQNPIKAVQTVAICRCVGPIVAFNMIVVTEAFTKFENARQFNCFAGIAPFQYTSGSSQHSRARVSHRADKCIKTLFHLAAVSVIGKVGGEMKSYFLRKVEEGKHKMSVINALRAKIVARMFAVIKNNKLYKPILS